VARAIAFSTLRESVRARYDLPTFSTATFVKTADVNSLINESLQGLAALLISCFGDDYYAATSNITASANTSTTALPTRCIKVLKLWWVRGTDDIVPIMRGNADDTLLASYSAKSWTDYAPRYRLLGTASIRWLPTPNASYTVACEHVALPADLSADGDTVECGPGWEQWVINDVCAKIAIKEEKDPSVFFAERANWEQRIVAQAPERAESDALQLRDVTSGGLSAYQLKDLVSQRY